MNYDWETLTRGVYRCRLPFLDVTVGLVHGRTGVLLIDCGTTLSEAERLAADVGELTAAEVSRLVMTHHHFDHILGCGGFRGSVSYAAPPVARALGAGLRETCSEAVAYGADPEEVDRAAEAVRPPNHQVWHGAVDLGDRTVRIAHPGRGHTDHDLVVIVPDDQAVVFCGDLIEESADPAIGPDADPAAWPASLGRVIELGGEGALLERAARREA